MQSFMLHVKSNVAKLVRYSPAYHEVLLETPNIYSKAVQEIVQFMKLPSDVDSGAYSNDNRKFEIATSPDL
jgi:hypothetical protein